MRRVSSKWSVYDFGVWNAQAIDRDTRLMRYKKIEHLYSLSNFKFFSADLCKTCSTCIVRCIQFQSPFLNNQTNWLVICESTIIMKKQQTCSCISLFHVKRENSPKISNTYNVPNLILNSTRFNCTLKLKIKKHHN